MERSYIPKAAHGDPSNDLFNEYGQVYRTAQSALKKICHCISDLCILR